MNNFNADIHKILKIADNLTEKGGYVYPSKEFITDISEEDKMFDLELAEKTNEYLLNKYAIFTALLSSALVDESRYASEVVALERELSIVKADVYNSSDAKGVRDRERQRDADKQVVDLQEKLTLADAILKRYTALRISYEKFSSLYSRALTVKLGEIKFQ